MPWTNRAIAASGGGGVASVAAGDASITIGGTGSNPTVETGPLDQLAGLHPPAAAWSNNGKKITNVANGTGAGDVAAFGQIPTSAGAIGGLVAANNLSDVASAGSSRTNLGLGTAATQASSAFLQPANNLADVSSAGSSRTNLGLGSAATQASSAFLQPANNLSDVASAGSARANLGNVMNFRGAWAAFTTYQAYDVVTFAAALYLAPATFTSGASFNSGNWTLIAGLPPSVGFQPAAPTATASATLVMMGLGSTVTYTPARGTTLDVALQGLVSQAGSTTVGCSVVGYYGTGAAPANGVAVTGTTFCPTQSPSIVGSGGKAASFGCQGRISGLVVGTTYWFDLAVSQGGGTTVGPIGLTAFIVEVN